jgi:hypothetical protein
MGVAIVLIFPLDLMSGSTEQVRAMSGSGQAVFKPYSGLLSEPPSDPSSALS